MAIFRRAFLVTAKKKLSSLSYQAQQMMSISSGGASVKKTEDEGYLTKHLDYQKMKDKKWNYPKWVKERLHTDEVMKRDISSSPPTGKYVVRCRSHPREWTLDFKTLNRHYLENHKTVFKTGIRCRLCGNFFYSKKFYGHKCEKVFYLYKLALQKNKKAIEELKEVIKEDSMEDFLKKIEAGSSSSSKKKK